MNIQQARTPKDYLTEPYMRIVTPQNGGTFMAEIMEFPGCIAQGSTPAEAYENLEQIAEDWLAVALEKNREIPPPSGTQEYSGRLVVRLPKNLHRQAAIYAAREGSSLNQFIATAIAARVSASDLYSKLADRCADLVLQSSLTVAYGPIPTSLHRPVPGRASIYQLFQLRIASQQSGITQTVPFLS